MISHTIHRIGDAHRCGRSHQHIRQNREQVVGFPANLLDLRIGIIEQLDADAYKDQDAQQCVHDDREHTAESIDL